MLRVEQQSTDNMFDSFDPAAHLNPKPYREACM